MDKRLFDLIFASVALIFLMPLLVMFMAMIKLTSRGPVLFVQERIGLNGKPFRMMKLRSMVTGDADERPRLTTRNDPRVTTFGRFLRKHKLDELPQLINVLKGDMSVVGPRPELPRYVDMFKNDYDVVLTVRPGITDYASIEFRDESEMLESPETFEKHYVEKIMPAKIMLYRQYVESSSWRVDLGILIQTLSSLVRT